MWLTTSLVYWSSLGLLGYTYAGYPMLIQLLARVRPRPPLRAAIEPTVSVVMAVHDEERHIARKLENLFSLDYPADRLQVVVVSDGSQDQSEAIVASYQRRYSNLVLESLPEQQGKAAALNRGVQRASGEVVLFCDARQQIATDALRRLVPAFADPQVGAVSGELFLAGTRGPGAYWAYEKRIRTAEGCFDSVVGATGALFAIRRHLFATIPQQTLLDDVYTPMQIALQGYRILFEPGAKVFDEEATLRGEFARKARTLAGNFQLLELLPELLHPGKNRLFFQFVSHKVLRLLCPFALGTLLLSNVVLVATAAPGWPFFALTLGGQLLGYGLALKGVLSGEKAGRFARLSQTFVVLNVAALEGLRRYLRRQLSWTTAPVESERPEGHS